MSMDTVFQLFIGFFIVVVLILMIVAGISMSRKIAVNKAMADKLRDHHAARQKKEQVIKETVESDGEVVAPTGEAPPKSYGRRFVPSNH